MNTLIYRENIAMKNRDNEMGLKPIIKSKWRKILVVAMIMALIIMPLDAIQQIQYNSVREAYTQMERGEYRVALENLEEYKNSHTSSLYWELQYLINGKDSEYGIGMIEKAIKECNEKIKDESM